jgi:hypothetical protein
MHEFGVQRVGQLRQAGLEAAPVMYAGPQSQFLTYADPALLWAYQGSLKRPAEAPLVKVLEG